MEPTNTELMAKLTEVLAEVTKLKKRLNGLEDQYIVSSIELLEEVKQMVSNTEAAVINLSTPGV